MSKQSFQRFGNAAQNLMYNLVFNAIRDKAAAGLTGPRPSTDIPQENYVGDATQPSEAQILTAILRSNPGIAGNPFFQQAAQGVQAMAPQHRVLQGANNALDLVTQGPFGAEPTVKTIREPIARPIKQYQLTKYGMFNPYTGQTVEGFSQGLTPSEASSRLMRLKAEKNRVENETAYVIREAAKLRETDPERAMESLRSQSGNTEYMNWLDSQIRLLEGGTPPPGGGTLTPKPGGGKKTIKGF